MFDLRQLTPQPGDDLERCDLCKKVITGENVGQRSDGRELTTLCRFCVEALVYGMTQEEE